MNGGVLGKDGIDSVLMWWQKKNRPQVTDMKKGYDGEEEEEEER